MSDVEMTWPQTITFFIIIFPFVVVIYAFAYWAVRDIFRDW